MRGGRGEEVNAHIAISELCRVAVYVFFLAQGMFGGEGWVFREKVFVEDDKVIIETLEHGLWGRLERDLGRGATRTWRTGRATCDCAALTLRTGAPVCGWKG